MKNLLALTFGLACLAAQAAVPKVWLDADTGNEMDDVYALVRVLMAPSVNVVGVSSTHFNNPDLLVFAKWNQYPSKGIDTVGISQQLNEELLRLMGKTGIATPLGADRQMGRAWGGYEARGSAAATELIKAVKALPAGQKLDILTLGALTNIASAIALDQTIVPRIRCYMLGASYDIKKQAWNKNEFNIRNDLNAFDYLLNSQVEMIVMPISVAKVFEVERDATYARLAGAHPVLSSLKLRWEQTNPQDKIRTLWDVALVQAYLRPDLAKTRAVKTPPENTQRLVTMYTYLDARRTAADFWNVVAPERAR